MDTRKSIKERSFLKLHTRNRNLSTSICKGHLLELQKLIFISNSDCCKASYFTNINIYIIYIHTKHQTFVLYIYIYNIYLSTQKLYCISAVLLEQLYPVRLTEDCRNYGIYF